MQLSPLELERLAARHAHRRHMLLRDAFGQHGPDHDARCRYFTEWAATLRQLDALREDDLLCLLEIGYRQNTAMPQTAAFQTCVARGRWYGRRLWIVDQLERMGIDLATLPTPPD